MKALILTDKHGTKGQLLDLEYTSSPMIYSDKENNGYHLSEFVVEEYIESEVESALEKVDYYTNRANVLLKFTKERSHDKRSNQNT